MASEQESLRETLIDLEVRVAFQGKTVTELDQVVRSLFTRIEALEKELALLRTAETGPAIGPANEPPPHY